MLMWWAPWALRTRSPHLPLLTFPSCSRSRWQWGHPCDGRRCHGIPAVAIAIIAVGTLVVAVAVLVVVVLLRYWVPARSPDPHLIDANGSTCTGMGGATHHLPPACPPVPLQAHTVGRGGGGARPGEPSVQLLAMGMEGSWNTGVPTPTAIVGVGLQSFSILLFTRIPNASPWGWNRGSDVRWVAFITTWMAEGKRNANVVTGDRVTVASIAHTPNLDITC